MKSHWKHHGLAITLFVLFALCLVGHAISGWHVYNDDQREHHGHAIHFTSYLATNAFAETVFENWESEFLQMGAYVVLTVFLRQRGSAESKSLDEPEDVDARPEDHRGDADAPRAVRAGGWRLALYRNSLSLAFALLFALSFIGHAIAGARLHAGEAAQHGEAESANALAYMARSQFWYESFQNWQSEFLAVFSIVVLSIWLRQWGSPESKPVHAPHGQTGK